MIIVDVGARPRGTVQFGLGSSSAGCRPRSIGERRFDLLLCGPQGDRVDDADDRQTDHDARQRSRRCDRPGVVVVVVVMMVAHHADLQDSPMAR
ncbi:hypothetical protein [Nocardia jinanensis]|uniref:hypothetical protein n=1 Tax=Nocardia jinanensis TaxID=382504 RepID=UPI0007A48218|nr:hypothetical protein [Nocardia jinanensis]